MQPFHFLEFKSVSITAVQKPAYLPLHLTFNLCFFLANICCLVYISVYAMYQYSALIYDDLPHLSTFTQCLSYVASWSAQ